VLRDNWRPASISAWRAAFAGWTHLVTTSFRNFLLRVRAIRCAGSPDPQHDFYRLQSERWLESLLLKDITRLDPALSTAHVYQQVPAFKGTDRGVIDLLAVTAMDGWPS